MLNFVGIKKVIVNITCLIITVTIEKIHRLHQKEVTGASIPMNQSLVDSRKFQKFHVAFVLFFALKLNRLGQIMPSI